MTLFELYYGRELSVYIYDAGEELNALCERVITELGCRVAPTPAGSDLSVAPLLRRFLSPDEYGAPRYGTLIFHPSLLPRHRGRDAIRWAYRLGEKYTGVTWFWCNSGVDDGDICEQEVVHIPDNTPPRLFYEREVVPAMARTLRRAIEGVMRGEPRRVPQYEPASTYEPPITSIKLTAGC